MTTAKEATLRRIAIVLASLPEPVVKQLLGSLHGDSQQQIRTALGSLADVDPLERRRALDGFANSVRQGTGRRDRLADAAEIVFSRTAIRNLNQRGEVTTPAASVTESATIAGDSALPFAFLADVDDETLVGHLEGELPQTLAIILASIAPAQAARVLPRLAVAVRAEAMRRMANLKEVPRDLIDEIGSQLRQRLEPTRTNPGAGRRALDAILAAMPTDAAVTRGPRRSASGDQSDADLNLAAKTDLPPAIKLAEGTWPDGEPISNRRASPDRDRQEWSPLSSTDSIHEYLVSLPVERLRDALGKVPARSALLTLCGLPTATAEAVLESLPRRQSKQAREQLSQLGTLQLREIDNAKETVAAAAYRSDLPTHAAA